MLWFSNGYHVFGLRLHELGWWMGLIFVFILPINELLFAKAIRLKNIGHSIFGLIYISLPLGLMMDLYGILVRIIRSYSPEFNLPTPAFNYYPVIIPLAIILSLWINDTMAYIVGSLIGKTPFSKISPKKTWEGIIGGVIFSIFATGFLFAFVPIDIITPGIHFKVEKTFWFILAAIASVFGIFGDLLESKLKRLANVKDSGHIMPGHGGFLDRFDSLLLAIPFVWLFVYFFMK